MPHSLFTASEDVNGLYIQYGCGTTAPETWVNFDASPRLRFERLPGMRRLLMGRALFPANVRYGDIVAGLPVAGNSADGVFCSHVLEHLYRDDVAFALRNTFEILKPGGVFRLVVPDLEWRIGAYAASRGTSDAAEMLQHRLHLRPVARPRGLVGVLRATIGLSMHQWMYDEPSMTRLLKDAGFTAIRRAEFGDADDPAFSAVEEMDRFVDGGHRELAMECRKPSAHGSQG